MLKIVNFFLPVRGFTIDPKVNLQSVLRRKGSKRRGKADSECITETFLPKSHDAQGGQTNEALTLEQNQTLFEAINVDACLARELITPSGEARNAKTEEDTLANQYLRRWARRTGSWLSQYIIASLITSVVVAAIFFAPMGFEKPSGSAGNEGTGGAISNLITVDVGIESSNLSFSSAQSGGADAGAPAETGEAMASLSEMLDEMAVYAQGELPLASMDLSAWATMVLRGQENTVNTAFDASGGLGEIFAGGFSGSNGTGLFGQGGSFDAMFGASQGMVIRGGGAGSGLMVSASFMPEPMYPEIARRERREGMVELGVSVDANGRARSVEIAKTSGHTDLDEAARITVLQQWRFLRMTGREYAHTLRECVVQITFNLQRH